MGINHFNMMILAVRHEYSSISHRNRQHFCLIWTSYILPLDFTVLPVKCFYRWFYWFTIGTVKVQNWPPYTLVITIKDIHGIMILLALGLGGAMVALLIECSAKAITLRYEEATPIPKKAWTNSTLPPGFQGWHDAGKPVTKRTTETHIFAVCRNLLIC